MKQQPENHVGLSPNCNVFALSQVSALSTRSCNGGWISCAMCVVVILTPFPCEWPHLTCYILWLLSGHGSMLRTAYYILLRPYLAVAALMPIFRLEQHPSSVLTAKLSTESAGGGGAGEYFPNPDFPRCGAEHCRAEQVGESWTKHTRAPILCLMIRLWFPGHSQLISSKFTTNKQTNKQTNQIWELKNEGHILCTRD